MRMLLFSILATLVVPAPMMGFDFIIARYIGTGSFDGPLCAAVNVTYVLTLGWWLLNKIANRLNLN